MTAENHVIAKYQYEFHNQFTDDSVNDNPLLYLYGQDKNLLAVIAFVNDGQQLDAPVETIEGHVAVQMHERQFMPLIDALRNEKPLIFSWSPGSAVVRISTDKEPVGEQELKRMFRFLYI